MNWVDRIKNIDKMLKKYAKADQNFRKACEFVKVNHFHNYRHIGSQQLLKQQLKDIAQNCKNNQKLLKEKFWHKDQVWYDDLRQTADYKLVDFQQKVFEKKKEQMEKELKNQQEKQQNRVHTTDQDTKRLFHSLLLLQKTQKKVEKKQEVKEKKQEEFQWENSKISKMI